MQTSPAKAKTSHLLRGNPDQILLLDLQLISTKTMTQTLNYSLLSRTLSPTLMLCLFPPLPFLLIWSFFSSTPSTETRSLSFPLLLLNFPRESRSLVLLQRNSVSRSFLEKLSLFFDHPEESFSCCPRRSFVVLTSHCPKETSLYPEDSLPKETLHFFLLLLLCIPFYPLRTSVWTEFRSNFLSELYMTK